MSFPEYFVHEFVQFFGLAVRVIGFLVYFFQKFILVVKLLSHSFGMPFDLSQFIQQLVCQFVLFVLRGSFVKKGRQWLGRYTKFALGHSIFWLRSVRASFFFIFLLSFLFLESYSSFQLVLEVVPIRINFFGGFCRVIE
jgi:hypothetical protein